MQSVIYEVAYSCSCYRLLVAALGVITSPNQKWSNERENYHIRGPHCCCCSCGGRN